MWTIFHLFSFLPLVSEITVALYTAKTWNDQIESIRILISPIKLLSILLLHRLLLHLLRYPLALHNRRILWFALTHLNLLLKTILIMLVLTNLLLLINIRISPAFIFQHWLLIPIFLRLLLHYRTVILNTLCMHLWRIWLNLRLHHWWILKLLFVIILSIQILNILLLLFLFPWLLCNLGHYQRSLLVARHTRSFYLNSVCLG